MELAPAPKGEEPPLESPVAKLVEVTSGDATANLGPENTGSAIEDLHVICQEDGLTDAYINLARKAGAISFISNGVNPI